MGCDTLYFNALASSQQDAFPFSEGTFLFSEGTSSFATPAWQTCHAGVANVPCRRGKPSGAMYEWENKSQKRLRAVPKRRPGIAERQDAARGPPHGRR